MCGQFLAATNMISDNICEGHPINASFLYYCGDINGSYAGE